MDEAHVTDPVPEPQATRITGLGCRQGCGRLTDVNVSTTDEKQFAPTRWTLVLDAVRQGGTEQARRALAELCRLYWFPLHAYVRRRGYNPADAQDLTQAFFARLLEKNWLDTVATEKGWFQAFLSALGSRPSLLP